MYLDMQNKQKLDKKILVTGGGSGGHVSVATAFIDALSERFSDINDHILYVGSDLGMVGEKNSVSVEQRRMADRNIKFVSLRAGKLQRRLELTTILLLFRTLLGVVDAFGYIREFRPDLVFCTGGYLGVPIAIASWFYRIPIYLHEQTAAVGMSNSFVGKIAKRVYITFPTSEKYFNKEKVLHTGNLLRPSIFKVHPKADIGGALQIMKKNGLPVIYVSGGGQGSHIINTLIRDMLKYSLMEYQILLQTGDNQIFKDYDVIYKEWKKLPANLQNRLFVTKFVTDDDIGAVFKAADLYLGRSGANTVYELGVMKIPSILIPIPWVTHNEQELNANILKDLGLGRVILEGEATGSKLHAEIKDMLLLKKKRNLDADAIEKVFVLNAKEAIMEDLFKSIYN
ncbi:MAG: hypothetical protein UT34_C0001G0199 [candidate division WS6 bacterium GW2011_GWF2_39_15]|uniref:UDP-N-acetylglucosamine--N-acetylmuramyl-(pentapeptide) pyrophosphoryl-undecaprenol N-acetylglucosamine transferase n=1 Tax=candidate division WS6 bacterium GW2011_GWF2_39_15 TaxID=1619100 RepID=A0A0G0MQ61_9BACT|nr:MAG: hypothetical protein UT34_C0001G0199 [candidate division WS6 bacterium GW2011_GWF2_39_15]